MIANQTNGWYNGLIRVDIPALCQFSLFIDPFQAYFKGPLLKYEWSNYSAVPNGMTATLSDVSTPQSVLNTTLYLLLTFEFYY